MSAFVFPDTPIYAWVVLPALIFLARITDVSLGTVRLIFVSRGFKYLAPLVGFFEVLIWILIIGQIMQNLGNPLSYVAYAGGFRHGQFRRAPDRGEALAGHRHHPPGHAEAGRGPDRAAPRAALRRYVMNGHGANGPVQILFTIVRRREAGDVIELVKQFNPQAFYSVEDVDLVERGVFPLQRQWYQATFQGLIRPFRKGK
jgi:hypothetical protein